MKKLVLFAAVAVAISFASCSNKANTEAAAEEAPAVAETEVVDVVEEPAVEEGDAIEETAEEVVVPPAPPVIEE